MPAPRTLASLCLVTPACRATAENAGAVVGLTDSEVSVSAAGTAAFTVYGSATDVDGLYEVVSVGVNTAVKECAPSLGVTDLVASPVAATKVPAPRSVAPSKNSTAPVG